MIIILFIVGFRVRPSNPDEISAENNFEKQYQTILNQKELIKKSLQASKDSPKDDEPVPQNNDDPSTCEKCSNQQNENKQVSSEFNFSIISFNSYKIGKETHIHIETSVRFNRHAFCRFNDRVFSGKIFSNFTILCKLPSFYKDIILLSVSPNKVDWTNSISLSNQELDSFNSSFVKGLLILFAIIFVILLIIILKSFRNTKSQSKINANKQNLHKSKNNIDKKSKDNNISTKLHKSKDKPKLD